MDVKIENNVPIPERCGIVSLLRKMKVGESIVVPISNRPSLSNVAKQAGIDYTSKKISDTEIRIWRI